MSKLYVAPMEGLTGFVWRRAHRAVFGGADCYYSPYIAPDQTLRFQTKHLRELEGGEEDLVPQLMTRHPEHFIWAAREIQRMGYDEVNLNLGCPSGTVTAKGRGSGMLRSPEALDHFLEECFSALPDMGISLKTRIGLEREEEWPALLGVFEKYPLRALAVHPRLQKQMYGGLANRALFLRSLGQTKLPLIYNGDIASPGDEAFSYGCGVMVGRGMCRFPGLLRQHRGGAPASREEIARYHELLLEGYREYMPGPVPLMHRMREQWLLLADSFVDTEPMRKAMTRARRLPELLAAVNDILGSCPLRETE